MASIISKVQGDDEDPSGSYPSQERLGRRLKARLSQGSPETTSEL